VNGSQLHTEIGFGDGGLRVRELSRAQNKSNHDKANKTLQAAYGQITTLCEANNINKTVAETTKLLYKKAEEGKIFKGKSQDAIIAGCIFIACRQHEVPRSFREIYKLTNVSKKEIGRTFKVLEAYLGKVMRDQGAKVSGNGAVLNSSSFKHTKSTEASELIGRATVRLQLPTYIRLIAEECAARVTQMGVAAGRSPLSITGACLYLVAHLMGDGRSPKEIGSAVDVSDGTIRTAYKLIVAELDRIVDDEWIRKGGDKSRVPPA
jgi:transcription initiation factor TFIIB